MPGLLTTADDVLRRGDWTERPADLHGTVIRLGVTLAAFALLYGAVMGAFRGLTGQDQWLRQVTYSALKVPVLLTGSFALALPSFFVLCTLLGLRRDFAEAVRALVAAQAGLAIVLASLSPLTLLWYASSGDYQHALLFNGLMFALASLAAQYLLRRYYAPLVRRNSKHRSLLVAWGATYILVAIQLAWLLRPFIGSPQQPVTFLRPDAWDNAYVYVGRLVLRALGF